MREKRIVVDDPHRFGKVAVLLGGDSAEREISLLSGAAVYEALCTRGINAHRIDTADDLIATLQSGAFDRVWIALHGRGGEDGSVQGLLELLSIPYTGSGIKGSAISMDKLRTKQLIAGAGLGTPDYRVVTGPQDFSATIDTLGLPLMIKPVAEGSSIGLVRVTQAEDLASAYATAAQYDCEVLAESWVTGCEYTVGVLQGEALPLVRIDAANTFYDYEAKYFSDQTRYVCPCDVSPECEREWQEMALRAFSAVGASGWGRVDFMLSEAGKPLLLEVNTVPGMTAHSLVPMAAKAAGIDFAELVWRILETSVAGSLGKDESLEAADGG
ncbi:MAG: D-alanine--D-alanine ligase [Gammaproteobacteria bacterium]|nr:D-alanine--D-alanine ligase [Chromatiales bacterium]MDP6674548.1 D-alanine--D-alanine ligase [Gammaproteobacteria bacterium]